MAVGLAVTVDVAVDVCVVVAVGVPVVVAVRLVVLRLLRHPEKRLQLCDDGGWKRSAKLPL